MKIKTEPTTTTSEELNEIVRRAAIGTGLITSAKFSKAYDLTFRWRIDEKTLHVEMSDYFEAADRDSLLEVAKWIVHGMLFGYTELDSGVCKKLEDAIYQRKPTYLKRMKCTDLEDECGRLRKCVDRLMSNGIINILQTEGFEFGWMDKKVRAYGCHSRVFKTVLVNEIFSDNSVPDHVLDFIVACNVCAMGGSDWEEVCEKKLTKYPASKKYLIKKYPNMKSKFSCPSIKEVKK